MELKERECPHCHGQVSLKVCRKYILRGTAYTVRCNHCNTELALVKEPIPFKWCPFMGFVSTAVPAEYFLFIRKLGFARSMTYAALIGIFCLGIIILLTFKRIRFKVVDF